MSDHVILKALEERQRWRSLHALVPRDTLVPDARALMDWFKIYFDTYPDKTKVEYPLLLSMIKTKVKLSMEQWTPLKHTVNLLADFSDEHAVQGIVNNLLERELSGRAGALIDQYESGQEVDLVAQLKQLVQTTSQQVENSSAGSYIQESISDILADEGCDRGLKLPTQLLQDHIKGLLGGALVGVAARVDKGKCQSPDTPVLLACGKVIRADAVKVGDVLAGPFRNNTVLSIASGVDQMYRVSYPWGEGYTVNSEHILSLRRSANEGKHRAGELRNVNVVDYMRNYPQSNGRWKGWKSGIELPDREQLMPAYLLGAWLGDGTTNKPAITTIDPEILKEFLDYYGQYSATYKGMTYAFYGTPMLQQLRDIGVFNNKHIPDCYLNGSREQRIELLSGIVDSDGHVRSAGGVEVTTKLEVLKEGYLHLARSLGIHATATKAFKRACNSDHQGDWYWRVLMGSEAQNILQCRIPRKQFKQHSKPKRNSLSFQVSVEPVGLGEYVGWTLDGDHLYLLGDFTVTHNTSLLTSIAAHLAPQIPEYFGEDRPILWLNNEGNGRRIYPRIYTAALGVDSTELLRMDKEGKLIPAYVKAVGRVDRIRVKDIHGATMAQIEQVVEAMNPSVVIVDMMANVRTGAVAGGNKTDALEGVWQAFREMAVIHDFIGIGTAQISADGDDMLYPQYGALKDSKTGVQGTLDVLLMLGALNSPDYATIRGLSTPKNKFSIPGKPSHCQGEVHFDATLCKFTG